MSQEVNVTLTVNGERVTRRIEARRHLIDFLRLDLGLMGSHAGCEHGFCGACTVRVDGAIVRGCLVLAASLEGAKVDTIEGVSDWARFATCRTPSLRATRPNAATARPACCSLPPIS